MIMKRSEKKTDKTGKLSSSGFTLIELMVVIAIIGILASIAIPNYMRYRKKAEIVEIAANLRNFKTGFIAYAIDHEYYPDDCHTDTGAYGLPNTTIEDYISLDAWSTPTPLGGRYNWEGPDQYWDSAGYLGISIDEGTAPTKDFRFLDGLIDDGDLSDGIFRLTPNGRYTYMIEDRLN